MYITGKWELPSHRRNWRDVIVMPAFHKKKGLNYQNTLDEKHSLYCATGHRLFAGKKPRMPKHPGIV